MVPVSSGLLPMTGTGNTLGTPESSTVGGFCWFSSLQEERLVCAGAE
jgi:hypothetical protein